MNPSIKPSDSYLNYLFPVPPHGDEKKIGVQEGELHFEQVYPTSELDVSPDSANFTNNPLKSFSSSSSNASATTTETTDGSESMSMSGYAMSFISNVASHAASGISHAASGISDAASGISDAASVKFEDLHYTPTFTKAIGQHASSDTIKGSIISTLRSEYYLDAQEGTLNSKKLKNDVFIAARQEGGMKEIASMIQAFNHEDIVTCLERDVPALKDIKNALEQLEISPSLREDNKNAISSLLKCQEFSNLD